MAASPLIQPFAALRPAAGRAPEVIARPYDVLSHDEAVAEATGRALSFLHVSRAEIDLPPGTDPHAPEVYAQARRALDAMTVAGVLVRDPQPCYYAYELQAGLHKQLGVAAAGSVAAYVQNRIRRHEHTRPDKELDRTRQIEAVAAHTGLVLTVHRPDAAVAAALQQAAAGTPIAGAVSAEGTRHRIWAIRDASAIDVITAAFEAMDAIYIADGHHRSAAAARVAESGRFAHADRFVIVSFPTDQVRILDYNRIVRDLNGHTAESFLTALAAAFAVEPVSGPCRPGRPGQFGLYLAGRWHRLTLLAFAASLSPVEALDVSLLSRRVLEPLLGIHDPRTDPRIDFVGGGRGLDELVRRVDHDGFAAAFAMYPTALDQVMAVADAGDVMPPKSTWFEPKLADGLLSLPLA
jgi:uncharacterized protein (DUF1015 family)